MIWRYGGMYTLWWVWGVNSSLSPSFHSFLPSFLPSLLLSSLLFFHPSFLPWLEDNRRVKGLIKSIVKFSYKHRKVMSASSVLLTNMHSFRCNSVSSAFPVFIFKLCIVYIHGCLVAVFFFTALLMLYFICRAEEECKTGCAVCLLHCPTWTW